MLPLIYPTIGDERKILQSLATTLDGLGSPEYRVRDLDPEVFLP